MADIKAGKGGGVHLLILILQSQGIYVLELRDAGLQFLLFRVPHVSLGICP
jgi:hypothetical protein